MNFKHGDKVDVRIKKLTGYGMGFVDHSLDVGTGTIYNAAYLYDPCGCSFLVTDSNSNQWDIHPDDVEIVTNEISIETAVEMTARCKEVDYNWRSPKDCCWTATLWDSHFGQYRFGTGASAWEAVKNAHDLVENACKG